MSKQSMDYIMKAAIGSNERLLVYYDFSGMSGRHIGNELDNGLNYGVIENCEPATDTGLYSGVVVGFGSSVADAKEFTTGTFLNADQAHLNESNIKTTGTNNLPYSDMSVLVDFEFNGEVSDGVLFGSLEKTNTDIRGETFLGAKGYNFGLTSRGHLFYQGFNQNGDFIKTSPIELSKRNIVGFSLGSDSLSLVSFDYLNNKVNQSEFNVNTSFIASNEEFYLGGSHTYFRGGPAGPSGEFKTLDVNLNSFVVLNGHLPPSVLFQVGSGLVGTYFEASEGGTLKRRITGYSQEITYKTGITGYDYEDTGSINVSTGDYMLTGNFFNATSTNTGEGDRYFIYRSFDDALSDSGVKTFVKEEVGALYGGGGSGYQYTPTGEGAFDTLGLRNIDVAVNEYVEQRGISGAAEVGVTLFGSRIQTGVLSGISGVIQTPLYQEVTDRAGTPTSGVAFLGESALFKKDFIKFLGEPITIKP